MPAIVEGEEGEKGAVAWGVGRSAVLKAIGVGEMGGSWIVA
jgi:hypothetical protein